MPKKITLKKQILSDLTQFGLNPSDWQLSPFKAKHEILIQHKKDPTFSLLGVLDTKSTEAHIRKLSIASF